MSGSWATSGHERFLYSGGNQISLKFTTNDGVTSKGWLAYYMAVSSKPLENVQSFHLDNMWLMCPNFFIIRGVGLWRGIYAREEWQFFYSELAK